MTEVYFDQTRESLFKLWEELNENPQLAHGDMIKDVWERLQELERKESKEKLTKLKEEINTYLAE